MKLFVILLLTYGVWAPEGSCQCLDCQCNGRDTTGVYWESYNGVVPYNAIGVDDESIYRSNIFIGFGYIEDIGVLPGTLYRGKSSLMVYSKGMTYAVCDNIMILCSKHKSRLRWVNVNITHVPLLSETSLFNFVFGGFERDIRLFIGKRYFKGGIKVGKVFPKDQEEDFTIINEYGMEEFFDEFEILVYT